MSAFAAGAVAGLGVAMPLGAIGVLLVQEGVAHGWRRAAAGATGVALVDLGYAVAAVAAVAAGTAVTAALAGRERAVRLTGAAALVAVAVRGLLALRRPARGSVAPPPAAHVLRRFVAMTAVNPLTAVYFVVLTAGLGSAVAGARAGAAFATGVFAASWAWQLVLASIGSLAGARLPHWMRAVTSVAGYLVVLGYAARLAR